MSVNPREKGTRRSRATYRKGDCRRENATIHRDGAETRDRLRRVMQERRDPDVRQGDAERSADHAERSRLDEQQLHYTDASGSQRHAHADLLRAVDRAGEKLPLPRHAADQIQVGAGQFLAGYQALGIAAGNLRQLADDVERLTGRRVT